MKKSEKRNTEQVPEISVVICAYNVSTLINTVLESLRQQTFKDFEVIVVNDGSTDDTSALAREGGARVVDIPHSGLSAARNAGIVAARATIVAIIDADCWATEHWVKEIHKTLVEEGETVVTGDTQIRTSTFLGDCISGLGYPGGGQLGFDKMWLVDAQGYTSHLAGGNCAFIKKKIMEIGAFNPALTITADDVYLSLKILEKGLKIKYTPSLIMYHPARKDLRSFVLWHYARGKGSFFFKKQVGSFGQFYRLRWWSTKNMMRKFGKSPKIVVMVPLLVLSFVVQKVGYMVQKVKSS